MGGRSQRDGGRARGDLGGDEGGGVDDGSGPANDSEVEVLAGWDGLVWRKSYSEMGSRIVKTMRGMGGRMDAMILRAISHSPLYQCLFIGSHELG